FLFKVLSYIVLDPFIKLVIPTQIIIQTHQHQGVSIYNSVLVIDIGIYSDNLWRSEFGKIIFYMLKELMYFKSVLNKVIKFISNFSSHNLMQTICHSAHPNTVRKL